jgi:hypothetical protein
MRPIVIRPIILAASVLAAACSDQGSRSPTSPTSVVLAPTHSRSATRLPFRGSFTAADQGVVVPPSLLVQGTGEGNATHLGRFTMTFAAVADLATPTATGTFTFTAANGDQLLTTFVGNAADLIEPGVVSFTETLTIVGGTGRFYGATGTFTMRRIAIIDFATGASTSTGSFDGHINLKN